MPVGTECSPLLRRLRLQLRPERLLLLLLRCWWWPGGLQRHLFLSGSAQAQLRQELLTVLLLPHRRLCH
jgi:hypothetical protein